MTLYVNVLPDRAGDPTSVIIVLQVKHPWLRDLFSALFMYFRRLLKYIFANVHVNQTPEPLSGRTYSINLGNQLLFPLRGKMTRPGKLVVMR